MMPVVRRRKRVFCWLGRQRGTGLIETVVATGVLGVAVVAFLVALSTGFLGAGTVKKFSTADSLAQTQMEEIMSLPYAVSYAPTVAAPQGYSLGISAMSLYDGNLQKVAVTVYREGSFELRLEGYKAKKG